jgi:hypothetical protein
LQNANKRPRRREREILPRASARRSRHIAPDLGAFDAEFGKPRVEHGLLHRHGSAGVGDRRGIVERIDREVRSGETSLRQQRAEDEDRLIAALDALGDVDTRKETGACLANTLGCLVVGGRERTRRGRRGPRTLHGFAEREWRLRMRVRSGQDVSGQKDDDRSLGMTAVHLSHSLWNQLQSRCLVRDTTLGIGFITEPGEMTPIAVPGRRAEHPERQGEVKPLRVKHLAASTPDAGCHLLPHGSRTLPDRGGLARLATRSTGRGGRPDLALPLDHLLQGRRQLATSQVHTRVASEIERGEHRTATRAQLFGRKRKRRAAIHGVLLGLQQIEAHLAVMIRRWRGANGQVLEERAAQAQTRTMHARLHRCSFNPRIRATSAVESSAMSASTSGRRT